MNETLLAGLGYGYLAAQAHREITPASPVCHGICHWSLIVLKYKNLTLH